jgi:hypothetical protein
MSKRRVASSLQRGSAPLFSRLPRRGLLGNPYPRSCKNMRPQPRNRPLSARVSRSRRDGFGLPEGYDGPLTGKAGLRTPSEEEKKALAREFRLGLLTHHDDLLLEEQISLVPPEVLEREIWAAIADSSALHVIASTIDSRLAGEREIHGNISELVDRAYRLGALVGLLRREERRRSQEPPEGS